MNETKDTETAGTAETLSFEAEVSRLLHLMVHSVYSNKDIFLRELISNAADACERLRHLSVTDASLVADDPAFRILLAADKEAGTLTVADNGIGMDHGELIANLGTIARSGTRAFLEGLEKTEDRSALIGQFGVGFYASFMVADKVEVVSRRAGDDRAWSWKSDGLGTFTVEEAPLEAAPARGTRVVLHLNEESRDYAKEGTIERIVREYSAHVPIPIVLALGGESGGEGEERQLADGSALWRKPKSEVKPEELKDFYGHIGGQYDDPAITVHYRAEGRQEYSVLLFVPSSKPFDLFDPNRKGRVKLYVRRVFITDDAEILPPWLRFVRGVVDSDDLPLNLSREMLQNNPVLDAIRRGVTNRVISELEKCAEKDAETYAKVWDAFGPVIKEGIYEDPEKRDALFKLARFRTTKSGDGWRTLAEIVADLKENQTALYYALGDDLSTLKRSPHLEGYRARDVEVLLLADPVDAFWVRTALGYDGKPFQSVTQGVADLDKIALPEDEKPKEEAAEAGETASLVTALKASLGEAVSDVRASERLSQSPVCLVAPDLGYDRQLEKLLAQQEGAMLSKPILEINPRHAMIKSLAAKTASGDKAAAGEAAELLFGLARILDGEAPADPVEFSAKLTALMTDRFAG
ncbi:molecular chaperone HtpG [Rhodobium orientis]|uniref:Chaperone protein HtpG n=2 Tax=Rhodobium orientis TaxID=34017 RepID=A0A327JK37_9HYPH|nr:molecular chaperone HtpG [Rhodobium orientis]MBB4305176.1 molecular chaperone HtpG [Rhodobium orientis]MBK5949248.1 molecular chaperone HtpG [Rhodobium orientis]RAI26699.1 molecular chaperone HtpG [Rhodobium orientis]